MDYNQLKSSLRDIRMPEEMKERVVNNIAQKSAQTACRPAIAWRRPVAALLAVALCLTLAVPALTASVEPIYELMYLVSPAAAQYFQPVQKSDVDNGVKLEVVSAYIHGDRAEIYVTLQDLSGERIDETTDLYDSYSIHTPFDSSAHCERVGYDAQTRTATFLIGISQLGAQDIVGDKITFTVKQFLSQKAEYLGVEIPVDLSAIGEAALTQSVSPVGVSGPNFDFDSVEALLPGAPDTVFPIEGMDLTGMAFVDGKLHIQIAIADSLQNDNHGYVYFEDGAANRIDSEAAYFFYKETAAGRTDYAEYVFSITPDELADCSLYGDFWISGQLTQGDWKVTFPLERQ